MNFLKKNWLYVILFLTIVALNIIPRVMETEEPKEFVAEEPVAASEEKAPESLFVEFEEAQRRSERMEEAVKDDIPAYLIYTGFGLLIIVIFCMGLVLDGYFVLAKFRKKKVFEETPAVNPAPWTMGEIFKIILIALGLSYMFFIGFGVGIRIFEGAAGIKFTFYENDNFRMVFDTIVLDSFILLAILIMLWHVHKRSFASFGFARRGIAKNILYGVAGYAAILPLMFVIGMLIYVILNIFGMKPPPQPIVGLFLAEKDTTIIIVSSLIAAVFGPVIEEIFFRGVMYNAIKRKTGVFWSIMITSALFSFLHTHAASYFLVGFLPIMVLGMVLAYLYEKTGSLVPSITLHILNNTGSLALVFLFKYFNNLVG
ncbi:lysostaphin resistance A-like protein [Candidatus Omnitrophota bacterium]